MKKVIQVELDIDDDYLKKWNDEYVQFQIEFCFHEKEVAELLLKNNPFERSIAQEIEDYINNYYGINVQCAAKVIQNEQDLSDNRRADA